jgi:hypothetical protein
LRCAVLFGPSAISPALGSFPAAGEINQYREFHFFLPKHVLGTQGLFHSVLTMFHTILIFGAVATAGAICFFALFYRFMRGWNGDLGSH